MRKTSDLRPAVIRIVCAAVLIALSVGLLIYRSRQRTPQQEYDVSVVPPTCTEKGYSLYTGRDDGSVHVEDIVPALDHSYGDWVTETADDPLQPSGRSRSCSVCGAVEGEWVYPRFSIPTVALEGDVTGIGKTTEVSVTARIYGLEEDLVSDATLKYQGHESLVFDKKNYTLKFWKDPDQNEKNKITIGSWAPENKYILKACYIDPSLCRNLICADVWGDITASRETLPAQFAGLVNYGAVEGFPVALYLNGTFRGLYTMNLHKDDDLFGMSDGADHAILISNNGRHPEAYFREHSAFTDISSWEVEYCGTKDTAWAQQKLNDLVTFVMESDDETFRRDLGQYLDVDSAIDYLLGIYALGLWDHGASDLILVCYGRNAPLTASMYDMKTAFGLDVDGMTMLPASEFLPYMENGRWVSDTESLLWDRVLENFYPELCSRYRQLRQQILTPEDLCGRVTTYTSAIDPMLYAENDALYPGLPGAEDAVEQILAYIQTRFPLLDEIFMINEGLDS